MNNFRLTKIAMSTFLMLYSTQTLISQTLKTYKGAYEEDDYTIHHMEYSVKGIVSYQYYENENYERIFHGKFKFTKNNLIIEGQYKNNKKDGVWKFSNTGYDWSFSYKESATGKYLDGNMEGKWTYIRNDKKTGETLKKSIVYFNNNVIVGNYYHFEKNVLDNILIKVKLNNNGFFDGDFFTEFNNDDDIPYEDRRKYINGVLYWRLYRNISNGEVIEQFDDSKLVDDYLKEYNTINEISSSHNKERVFFDHSDINVIGAMNFWTCYNYDDYNSNVHHGYHRNPISIITRGSNKASFLPIQDITIDEVLAQYIKRKNDEQFYKDAISKADSAFNNNEYILAIKEYRTALRFKTELYPEEQISKAKERIYKNIIIKADSAFNNKIYDIAITEYLNALRFKTELYPKEQINKIKEQEYMNAIANADNTFKNKEYDLAISGYQNALTYIPKRYPKEQIEKANLFIEEIKREKERIRKIKIDEKKIAEKHKQILGNTIIIQKKKRLFDAYFKVYEELTKNSENNKYQNNLKVLLKLQEKIITLSNSNTKDLEKTLKNVDDIDSILKIMGI